jgi:hypothetical protein
MKVNGSITNGHPDAKAWASIWVRPSSAEAGTDRRRTTAVASVTATSDATNCVAIATAHFRQVPGRVGPLLSLARYPAACTQYRQRTAFFPLVRLLRLCPGRVRRSARNSSPDVRRRRAKAAWLFLARKPWPGMPPETASTWLPGAIPARAWRHGRACRARVCRWFCLRPAAGLRRDPRNGLASKYRKKSWITEGGFGGHEWPAPLHQLAMAFLYALRDGGVSLLTPWQTLTRQPDEHGLMSLRGPTKKTYVAMQFWRFIRPGMVRVAWKPGASWMPWRSRIPLVIPPSSYCSTVDRLPLPISLQLQKNNPVNIDAHIHHGRLTELRPRERTGITRTTLAIPPEAVVTVALKITSGL